MEPVTQTAESGQQTADETRTLRNFVGGSWVDAAGADTLDDVNPATGEVAALVPLSVEADVDAAVRAARDAFPGWRSTFSRWPAETIGPRSVPGSMGSPTTSEEAWSTNAWT